MNEIIDKINKLNECRTNITDDEEYCRISSVIDILLDDLQDLITYTYLEKAEG